MKYFITLNIATVACLCLAGGGKPVNKDLHFSFPRAVVVMESQDVKVVSDCAGCFSQPTALQPDPRFSDGHKFKDGTWAHWELVRKTSHGDVYLIVVERSGQPKSVTPVVFSGKAQVLIAMSNLTISILPEHPKRK